VQKTFNDWKHIKSLFNAESTTATNNFMIKQFFLQILQYNIRKSVKIQESFLIDREIHKFNIIVIQKQECNINNLQSFSSAHNFFYLVKNSLSQSRTCIYVNKCLRLNQWTVKTVESRLIIKLSFKLTFWIQLNLKLNYLHSQLNLSWIEHIFNLTWFNSTENWVNSTRLVKNLSLTSRKLNIEIFPTFTLSFCIIFLIESHEEKTWRLFDKES